VTVLAIFISHQFDKKNNLLSLKLQHEPDTISTVTIFSWWQGNERLPGPHDRDNTAGGKSQKKRRDQVGREDKHQSTRGKDK